MLPQKDFNSKCSAVEIIDSIISVTAHADRDMLKAGLVEAIYELVGLSSVGLFELSPCEGDFEVVFELKVDAAGLEKADSRSSHTPRLLRDEPFYKACVDGRQRVEETCENGQVHYAYPIIDTNNNVQGLLEVEGSQFSESDGYLLSALLKIYHNYLHILDESEKDTLTGLLNRRTFDRNLIKILLADSANNDSNLSEEYPEPKRRVGTQEKRNWLAVLDIDHFKKVNDNYGHLYGDEVLLLLSGVMQKSFRAYDKLFRFGGEEFVIVLKATNEEGVVKALERFRLSVQEYDFPQVGTVTISIGYVEIMSEDLPTELVGRADEALYYAKHNGRNQLHGYRKLVAAGDVVPHEPKVNDDIELF